jgi:polyisoprenoid-binding protein YceI
VPAPRTRFTSSALAIVLLLIAAMALTLTSPRAHADPKRWTTVEGQSSVSFDGSFALGDFSGRTDDVVGEFTADPADLRGGVSGALRVNPAGLRTGVAGRDRDMWRTLVVGRYPEIRFTVDRVEASFPSITERSDVVLTISGVMAIHGVERPMQFPGRVRLRDGRLWVRGEGRLRMSDFGIEPPRRFFLRVSDSMLVRFDVVLAAS